MASTKQIDLEKAQNPSIVALRNNPVKYALPPLKIEDNSGQNKSKSPVLKDAPRATLIINNTSYATAPNKHAGKIYSNKMSEELIKKQLGTQFDAISREYSQSHIHLLIDILNSILGYGYTWYPPKTNHNIQTTSSSGVLETEEWNLRIVKNYPLPGEEESLFLYGPFKARWELREVDGQKYFQLTTITSPSKLITDIINCDDPDLIQIKECHQLINEETQTIQSPLTLYLEQLRRIIQSGVGQQINQFSNSQEAENIVTEALEKIKALKLPDGINFALPDAEANLSFAEQIQQINQAIRDLREKITLFKIEKIQQWRKTWDQKYPDDFGPAPKYFLGKKLKKAFHKIFNPNSFRSDFASFFGYPRPTNPFHWFEYIFMGWLLNPIKNTIKFILEFIPVIIQKTAKWRIEERRRKFPDRASIIIGMLKVVRYTAKAIRLFTQCFTSPMRSATEAFYWGRSIHPALGYAAALLSLTISAAGVATIAFFAAPLLGLGISAYAVAGIAAGAWAGLSTLRAGIRKLIFDLAEKMKKIFAQPETATNIPELPPVPEQKAIAPSTGDTARVLKSLAAQSGDKPVVSSPKIETELVKSPSPEAKPVTEDTAKILPTAREQKSDVEIAMKDHYEQSPIEVATKLEILYTENPGHLLFTENWQWGAPRHTSSGQNDSDTIQPRL